MIALDPVTGNARWTFDPQVDRRREYSQVVSRGVAAWRDSDVPPAASCGARIYIGTIDARLIAIDAATGRRCDVFGQHGEIDLAAPVTMSGEGDYQVTSPPVIVNGVVIVGSSIGDNWNVDTGSGVVSRLRRLDRTLPRGLSMPWPRFAGQVRIQDDRSLLVDH